MATSQVMQAPISKARSRKSISHLPSQEHGGDKENINDDDGVFAEASKSTRKGRSKSIGPGGIDALQEGTGNRQKAAATPQYKSILKPTIVLSPPKPIPARGKQRSQSPRKGAEGISMGMSSPKRGGSQHQMKKSTPPQDENSMKDQTLVAIRSEEEQHAAAKERQELLARKDARRKSLANRRVSFAPEATLHTWDVVEMPEDSTTSSASGNSTRRGSTMSGVAGSPYKAPRSPMPSTDPTDPPSTPPEQLDEVQVKASPAPQRDLHQKKRRRSSGIPPMNFNNPDDFSSSPCSEASFQSDGTEVLGRADDSADSSDSDDKDLVEDETVTQVDTDGNTGRSIGSSSTGSSARLEAALRQAAQQAGTRGIDYDETGEMSMDMADDGTTAALQPFVQQDDHLSVGGNKSVAQLEQENLNPFSPAFKAGMNATGEETKEDDSMEFTQAVGNILTQRNQSQSPVHHRRKSVIGGRRKSVPSSRRLSGADSNNGDQTMEFTTAIGTIQGGQKSSNQAKGPEYTGSDEEDEEMTMEFTGVIGGVLDTKARGQGKSGLQTDDQLLQQQLLNENTRRQSGASVLSDNEMDMTLAGGSILPPRSTSADHPMDDATDMEMTKAIGQILPPFLKEKTQTEGKDILEREVDTEGALPSVHSARKPASARPGSRRATGEVMTATSETGSPSFLHAQPRPLSSRNTGSKVPHSPQPASRRVTPTKKPATPSKQVTPSHIRPETPGKTPPSKNVSLRGGSPKKLFAAEIRQGASPTKQPPNATFGEMMPNGVFTPSIVLKPRRRRSSGMGADKEGLGSPSVAAMLDRRSSIGDSSADFKPVERKGAAVRFEDPRVMEQELDAEAAQLHHAETGRGILEQEADDQDLEEEKDATANLKDMIQSMTPQKKKNLKGRKSLHVGAAKGLLGKRPAELDQSDEDSTPKRLKGRPASPVKSIRLPAPPSKDETRGRRSASSRLSLKETAGNARLLTPTTHGSPGKVRTVTTPSDQSRFKDVEDARSPPKFQPSLDQISSPKDIVEPADKDDRVHLQDFLNMTSIRFMELTTTKRRHTVMPNDSALRRPSESGDGGVDGASGLESCVIAGACTVPMLELYQHSCRELKKYISEGRSVVNEIEADTYEENPPLFREYMVATPEVKSLMDVQFKNVKTHARLLSKAMWYEWRMKLLDGLREGLVRIDQGLNDDTHRIDEQDALIQPALESLTHEHERLEDQVQIAQERVDELASCDQEELKEARVALINAENDIAEKTDLLEELKVEFRTQEERLELIAEAKEEYDAQAREADRVLEECRGWDISEVKNLQDSVSDLEHTYGWSITSASSDSLTMTYRSTLQLFFHPPTFRSLNHQQENAPISLTYIADQHEHHPKPLTTEKRFFLQIIRAQLQCLHQPSTPIPSLLHFITSSWTSACAVAEESHLLDTQFITSSNILSDEKLAIHATILLKTMATKVDVCFEVDVKSQDDGNDNDGGGNAIQALKVRTRVKAKVVYGEGLKEKMMGEFLERRVGAQGRRWVDGVGELEEKLRARGKK